MCDIYFYWCGERALLSGYSVAYSNAVLCEGPVCSDTVYSIVSSQTLRDLRLILFRIPC